MKKKVAFIFPTNVIGGHEYQGLEFAKGTNEFCAVTIYLNCSDHKGAFDYSNLQVVEPTFPFFQPGSIPIQALRGVRHMLTIRRLLSGFDYVVVCAGTLEAGLSIGIAMIGRRVDIYVPMFVDRNVLWRSGGTLYNCLCRNILFLFDRLITINKVQKVLLTRKNNYVILPNLIRSETRTFSLKKRDNRLFFVGRLDHQKNLMELLFWLNYSTIKYTEFILIGDGPLRAELELCAQSLLHIRVKFTGWINKSQQDDLIQPGDVLVLNSLYEGEPLVIREANERGNIVLARNIPGVRGCTYKNHRFSDANQLQMLLNSAWNAELKPYMKTNMSNIIRRRRNAILSLFV
jgi:glycosyltransferase involved in cell wall biosynthesis